MGVDIHGTSLATWAVFHPQPVGYSIGLLALTAGIMSVRPEMGSPEKMCWVALLIAFTLLEVRAINKGEEDSRVARNEQNRAFEAIVQDLKGSMEASNGQYESTIGHVDTVLKTTNQVANLAKDNLENLTGGNSAAYLAPQPPTADMCVPLAIVNPCKYPLTGVTVVITDVTSFPFKTYRSTIVGTLASHTVRLTEIVLKPEPKVDDPVKGIASFDIQIFAQNLRLHGVSFEAATSVLKEAFAIEWIDDREDYGEERFVILGMSQEEGLLYVVYTEREQNIRIISARRVTQYEEDEYFRQNSK